MAMQGLLKWFQRAGISLDAEVIRLQPTLGRPGACEVRAVADIAEGAVLASIPAEACLSVRTASCADTLEQEQLGGGLALILAVMHEVSLGAASKWCAHGSLVQSKHSAAGLKVLVMHAGTDTSSRCLLASTCLSSGLKQSWPA